MNRKDCIQAIQDKLGNRRLVYFGTRGADAETLLEIDQFRTAFSQIAPLHAISVKETCLERLTLERVDLNRYNIDYDERAEISKMREGLLEAFNTRAAIIPYRPSALVASAWFPRSDRVLFLSVFHEKQSFFEHKPWVESELKSIGIRTLPWKYYCDTESRIIKESAEKSLLVLRANRSDGGSGLSLIYGPQEVDDKCPKHTDGFIAVCPLLSPCVPTNINACIFPGGRVSFHPASFQIIGPANCTTRTFGYCGNDFAAIKELDGEFLDQMQVMTIKVGNWMYRNGYLGAFGIDFLIYEGELYLTEVNPRFQGSSLISALIDRELGRPDIYMDHIAAFLGIEGGEEIELRSLTAEQPLMAHVICHNTLGEPTHVKSTDISTLTVRCRLVPQNDVRILEEAIIFEAVFENAVTQNGMDLFSDISRQISLIAENLCGTYGRPTQQAS